MSLSVTILLLPRPGKDLIAMLDHIDKTASDPVLGPKWPPSAGKMGYAASRVRCDLDHSELGAVSDVCKILSDSPTLVDSIPKGDLVFNWLVHATRGRELVHVATNFVQERGPEVAVAACLARAKESADSVLGYHLVTSYVKPDPSTPNFAGQELQYYLGRGIDGLRA